MRYTVGGVLVWEERRQEQNKKKRVCKSEIDEEY